MKAIKWPAWLTRNLIGFSLASLFGDANHEIVPLVLPLLIAQLVGQKYAPQYVALISGFATIIASITGLLAGAASDKLSNRKPLIVLGYFFTGSLVGLLSLAQQWYSVFLLIVGAWIGRGLVSAPRNALIADSTDPAYYGHAFGFRQALDTLGAILGPFIVYLLANWPVRSLFLVALIPGLIAFMSALIFIHDVPRKRLTSQESFSLREILYTKVPRSLYILLGVFFLFGIGGLNKTLLVLRMQELLSPPASPPTLMSSITLLYLFRNAVQAVASYAIGALSDKIGRIPLLVLFGFGFFSIMVLLLAWQSTSLVMATTIFFFSGVSAGTYMSLQKSIIADLLPEQMRGTGYGILKTVDSIGNLISSLLIGMIWSYYSPAIAFLVAAATGLACILIVLRKIHM